MTAPQTTLDLILAVALLVACLGWYRASQSNRKLAKMSKELDDLTAEVSAEITVEQSAVVLINGFAAQLAAAGTDPAALTALHDSIAAESANLAAAVAANTPTPPAQAAA
jgi:hypothetical protein